MAQLMPLPLAVFCFSKIQIGFTLLVPAHLGSPVPEKGPLNACSLYISEHQTCNFVFYFIACLLAGWSSAGASFNNNNNNSPTISYAP